MPAPKQTKPTTQGKSPAEQTWSYYSKMMDKFRKLCHGDKQLFEQAENRIRAKLVVAQWEKNGKGRVDPIALSVTMSDVVMDEEDNRQVDALYRAKIALRDKISIALGKVPTEGWDSFHERQSLRAKVPNAVRQMELAGVTP